VGGHIGRACCRAIVSAIVRTVKSRMPIENERKFVLDDDGKLERLLAQAPGVERRILIQAYLDSPGLRLRAIDHAGLTRHIFGYKREIEGKVVEIETEIDPADFRRLWTLRRETLQKVRYSWPDGRFHWDVDFFKTGEGRTYFALAEVEMPETDKIPPPVPPRLSAYVLGVVPPGDPRFTSKRLADRAHAEQLLAEIRQKGRIE
jgi:CYTH domain-containing protein